LWAGLPMIIDKRLSAGKIRIYLPGKRKYMPAKSYLNDIGF